MTTRKLIDALRKGDERAIGWELSLLSRTPRRSRWLHSITRDEAMRFLARGETATQVALSEHYDGWVREAALRALRPSEGATLTALLRRANDWVPVVARLAGERAIAALPQTDDAALLEVLPLVFALTRQSRVDHRSLITVYLQQTRTRRGLARRIRRAYRNGPIGEWTSWRIIGEEETAHDLRQERLKAGTPRLQLETARQVAGESGRWQELLASRNPQVRRIALDHAPREAIEAALSDVNASVRNDARYLGGKRDFAALYYARLPSPGAVSGLGETGNRDDADVLVPLLEHPKADVRARAVESIFRLRGDDAETLLLAMLLDPVLKVQRASVEALVRSNLGFDPASVLRWPLSASMRRKLLQRTPRWAALLAVLREADTLEGAEEWLIRWARETGYGRTPPKPDEVAEARRLLQANTLNPQTAAALHDTLRGWPR